MFFLRSSAILWKNAILRLEPSLTAPSNSRSSTPGNEDFEGSGQECFDIIHPDEHEETVSGSEVCLSKTGDNFSGKMKRHMKDRNLRNEILRRRARKKQEPKQPLSKTKKDSRKNMYATRKSNNLNFGTHSENHEYYCNKYRNVKPKVDSSWRNEKRRKRFTSVQTSTTVEDGSGDTQSNYTSSREEQEKLERYRRINLLIIEAVSQCQNNIPNVEPSLYSEDDEDKLEFSEEEEKLSVGDEQEDTIDDKALRACLFLNQYYPNYFQHLIKRYQLNVATSDERELRMRKIDIIRISEESNDRLEKLENMYKENSELNSVKIINE